MKQSEWLALINSLGDDQFVNLCIELLMSYGYKNLKKLPGSGDGGKDIIGEYDAKYPEETIHEKVFFECRNWKTMVPQKDILGKLEQVRGRKIDRYVLLSASKCAAGLVDYVDRYNEGKATPKLVLVTETIFLDYLFKSPDLKKIVQLFFPEYENDAIIGFYKTDSQKSLKIDPEKLSVKQQNKPQLSFHTFEEMCDWIENNINNLWSKDRQTVDLLNALSLLGKIGNNPEFGIRVINKIPSEEQNEISKLLQAEFLFDSGKKNAAISLLSQLPPTCFTLNDQGVFYAKSGQLSKAISCYRGAIKLNEKFLLAKLNLADALWNYIKIEDDQLSKSEFKECLSILGALERKTNITSFALTFKSKIYRDLTDFKKAYSTINSALQINPYNHMAYNMKGSLLETLVKYLDENLQKKYVPLLLSLADKNIEKALSLFPLELYFSNSITMNIRLKNFEKAKSITRKANLLFKNKTDLQLAEIALDYHTAKITAAQAVNRIDKELSKQTYIPDQRNRLNRLKVQLKLYQKSYGNALRHAKALVELDPLNIDYLVLQDLAYQGKYGRKSTELKGCIDKLSAHKSFPNLKKIV